MVKNGSNNGDAPLYVCLGTPGDHLNAIVAAARLGRSIDWTINSKAKPGDGVLFYLRAPTSSFVATGQVVGEVFPCDRKSRWLGHYMAEMVIHSMLLPQLHITDIKRRFESSWPWLTQPRRSTRVPQQVAAKLLDLVAGVPQTEVARPLSDLEGVLTEAKVLRRSRSQILRNRALDLSGGKCAACMVDFSTVCGGLGVRVLQVHHRKQLSSLSSPRVTRVSQLAVLCANCHMLVHADRERAMTVAKLRELLKSNRQRKL